ncbi:MAG TPA: aminomethyl-transferring glycine dehydrogenase subunit GcvPB [Candidatus Dormibacteraeota bacterium]|nr:aminomethyl-transferring glycine dehydrogenase subunit GcvPB [Candidatus Dormibacteraeota bacterium]
MTFAQAKWNEPSIDRLSEPGKVGYRTRSIGGQLTLDFIPKNLRRSTPPPLPEVSEVEVIRHYTRLSQENFGVDLGLYPLGSCTMKYNPKVCDLIAASHKIQQLHPYQDLKTVQGILALLYEASDRFAKIVGVEKVTLQPAAGAQGEYTGLMLIRAYQRDRNEGGRDEIIVPDSAHGTNPASAAMAGYKVVEVRSNSSGCVDIEALKAAVGRHTAGLMITNPNTLGIFERDILEVARLVHDAGGLLYYDGANLNAIMGKARPGDTGFDIVHLNLHKTFATPHGGGGPGSGPIGVRSTLADYLPVPTVEFDGSKYYLDYDRPKSIGKIRAFHGNVAVVLRAYAYILLSGAEGLEAASDVAVLNANYLAQKLRRVKGFSLPFAETLPRKHEFVLSASKLVKETGISALQVAKRLLDFGIHPPTVYFPLIVEEAMMVEPTETVSKQELDALVRAFQEISDEAYAGSDMLKTAPHVTSVTRIDEAKANRPKTMKLTWRAATPKV